MTVKSPRVFIADFDLVGYSGHSFNQVFGFCEAARELGLETHVYVRISADPKVAAELNARAVLPLMYWPKSEDTILAAFADARRLLSRLWEELEGACISKQDILVITSSRPQVVFGAGQWLATLPDDKRPAIFFRFFRNDFFDFRTMTFSKTAGAYHVAARMLATTPGGDRVFLTVNDGKVARHLDLLTLRPTFFLPVPKYYGAVLDRPHKPINEFATIYVHINRPAGMSKLASKVVSAILQRRSDVNFVIRFCGYAFSTDTAQEAAARDFPDRNVRFLPGDQGPVEYLAAIEEADMILLPYDPVEYHDIVSGIFCEAAAMGKVAIVPARTWMADHVTGGRAAGVLFSENTADGMVDAVERAILDRTRLQAEAQRRARPFREENSCAKNLAGMIDFAGQTHDMRLPCVPLTDTTKALGSQHYFGEGWYQLEEGFGIWSDGDRAEINFSIRPSAQTLFLSAQIHPFLAEGHSRLNVSLIANKEPVGEWSFDAARSEDLDWSWRHVRIPEPIAASGEIQIVLIIRSPASPRELGLLPDPRNLGIALRQMALGPDARDLEFTEPAQKRSRLKRWLKRFR